MGGNERALILRVERASVKRRTLKAWDLGLSSELLRTKIGFSLRLFSRRAATTSRLWLEGGQRETWLIHEPVACTNSYKQ